VAIVAKEARLVSGSDSETSATPPDAETPPPPQVKRTRRRPAGRTRDEPAPDLMDAARDSDPLGDILRQARSHFDAGDYDGTIEMLELHRDMALANAPDRLLFALPIAHGLVSGLGGRDGWWLGRRDNWDWNPARARVKQRAQDYIKVTALSILDEDIKSKYDEQYRNFEAELYDKQIAELKEYKSNVNVSFSRTLLFPLLLLAVGLVLIIGSLLFPSTTKNVLEFAGAAAALLGVCSGIFLLFYRLSQSAGIDARLDSLQDQRRIAALMPSESLVAESQEGQYFSKLVQINVGNLERYYTLVKVQTSNSFWAALGMGLLGFALICIGLGYGFFHGQSSLTIAYVSTASGIIVEFIAGVFFVLYNRTVRQLKEYHDSLLSVQKILMAFKIVEDSKDEERPGMLKMMLEHLLSSNQAVALASGDDA
jgi:hypothetical protein